MNYHGTICADKVYTEDEFLKILNIKPQEAIELYKLGLPYFQRSRKQTRQIAGSDYHRFVSRNTQTWGNPDGETP